MIPLSKPFFNTEESLAVAETLKTGWVAGQGPKSKAFEEKFTRYIDVPYGIAVNNCTAALHLAMLALGISPGDEVIVSDYTFPATGHSVMYCGAKPVFCDIEKTTYNLDPAKIQELITKNTKAILAVHAFGFPFDLDAVAKIARENGLALVEDAACAAGAQYRGRKTGGFGIIGCFSFHARKNLTTGEGGMVVTHDGSLAAQMRQLSCFGMASAYDRQNASIFKPPDFPRLGYNYKMSDILASIGLVQLDKLDHMISEKSKLAQIYCEELGRIHGVQVPVVPGHVVHSWQSYVCLLDPGINRNRVIEKLKQKGIQAQLGTYASHLQPVYGTNNACPNSRAVYEQALALPIYVGMVESDCAAIAKMLEEVLRDEVR